MSLSLIYADRRANWTAVDLGTSVLRLGGWSVEQSSQMGEIGSSTLTFDDVSGNLGHSGDQILGLKILRLDDSLAPDLTDGVTCEDRPGDAW